MSKLLRIVLITIGIVLVLVIIGYFAIKAYLTPDTLRAIAQKVASETIQHPVEIGKVGLKIGFRVGITIDEITLPNVKGFSPGPMVRIDKTALNLKLIPLLRRQIVIGSIDLSGMRIKLERNKEGVLNVFPIAPQKRKGAGWTLSLSSINITNGEIQYVDEKSKTELRIEDVKQNISFKGSTIFTGGKNTLHVLKAKNVPEMVVTIVNEIEYDTLKKSMRLKKLSALYEPIHIDVSGTVEKSEILDLKADLSIDDVSKLKPLIPTNSRPNALSGALRSNFSVSGTIKEPRIDGKCELKNVTIVPRGMARGVEKLQGSLSFDTNAIRSIAIGGAIGNAQLNVNGSVDNLKDPVLNISVKIDGDLSNLESLTDEMKNTKMKGPMNVNVTIKGKANNPTYFGEYNLKDASLDGIGLAKPVTALSIKGTFQKDGARIDKCNGHIGRSDFSFSGNISNFKKPVIQLTNKSNMIDLDELIPKPEKSKKKDGNAVPMKLQGNVQITTLTGLNMVFKNINTSFVYENGVIDLRDCTADAFDGKVKFDFYYDASRPEPYRINTRMTSVSTKKVLKRFLKFENLEGRMDGVSNFRGNGLSKQEVVSNLSASGNLKVKNGVFNNFDILTKFLAWLGIKDYKNVNVSDLALYFKIDKGKADIKDWTLSSSVGDFLTNGTVGLTGSVDLDITTTLTKQYSDMVKRNHGDWLFPIDKNGRAILDIKASGSLASPKFSLDNKKIKDRLKGNIKDEFEKKKKEWEDKLKDLFKG